MTDYVNINNINLSLNQIKAFNAVAEHLNFSRAAESLFKPQSSISQQISTLEEKLGVELFNRDQRSVKMTNAGKIFYDYTKNILDKTSDTIDLMHKAKEGFVGSITIGFLVGPTIHFLPQLLKEFSASFPNIEVNLKHLTLQELNKQIYTDEIDVAFGISLGLQINHEIDQMKLYNSNISLFASNDHYLSHLKSVELGELSNENFVFRLRSEASEWYDYSIKLCIENGFYPNILSEHSKMETVMILVSANQGVAILPEYLRYYASSSIKVIPLKGKNYQVEVSMYHHKINDNPSLPFFLQTVEGFWDLK